MSISCSSCSMFVTHRNFVLFFTFTPKCSFFFTVLILFMIPISGLGFAGMAFGVSCFTSKVTYSNAFCISDVPGFFVCVDSSKTCLDGEYQPLT